LFIIILSFSPPYIIRTYTLTDSIAVQLMNSMSHRLVDSYLCI
jgi:hypothetical protein